MPAVGCGGHFANSAESGIQIGRVTDSTLEEISGVAASRRFPGILWAHNDGGKERVIALSTNGQVRARFDFEAKVEDMEDIAVGPVPESASTYLYIGDIGDNDHNRESIQIIRFSEPDMNSVSGEESAIRVGSCEVLKARYPSMAHDAEALLVDPSNGDILIVTKEKWQAQVFRVKGNHWESRGTAVLEKVASVGFPQVSGGDVSPDGTRVLLRSETAARLWRRRSGETLAEALQRRGESVPLIGPPREPNGEAIGFTREGNGYFTIGEGKSQSIYLFAISIR